MARARATDPAALVRAAAEVFRTKGYHDSTIADIADAVGVSRPTIYAYAKSKRWLLDRILHELLNDLSARLNADLNSRGTALDRLRAVIDTHIEAATANRAFYEIAWTEQTALSPAARKRFRAWAHDVTTDFRRLLEECLAENTNAPDIDPAVAANLIITMLNSIHRWYHPDGPVSPAELTDQILMIIGNLAGTTSWHVSETAGRPRTEPRRLKTGTS